MKTPRPDLSLQELETLRENRIAAVLHEEAAHFREEWEGADLAAAAAAIETLERLVARARRILEGQLFRLVRHGDLVEPTRPQLVERKRAPAPTLPAGERPIGLACGACGAEMVTPLPDRHSRTHGICEACFKAGKRLKKKGGPDA